MNLPPCQGLSFCRSFVIISVLSVVFIVAKCDLLTQSHTSINVCCKEEQIRNGVCDIGITSADELHFLDLPPSVMASAYGLTNATRFQLGSPSVFSCESKKGALGLSVSLLSNSNSTDTVKFTPNGYIFIGQDYFSPHEYCIEKLDENQVHLRYCQPDCSSEKRCLRRCCQFGQAYDAAGEKLECKSSGGKEWEPAVYANPYSLTTLDSEFHFVVGHPKDWCKGVATIQTMHPFKHHEKSLIRILADGSVVSKDMQRQWNVFNEEDICVEAVQNFPDAPGNFSGQSETDFLVYHCIPEDELQQEESGFPVYIVYSVAEGISSVFLILTLVVYLSLWERQNIHSWTLLGHIVSMLCLYSALVFANFYIILSGDHFSETICTVTAIFTHFFFLSTVSWLTLINFDVWWTFKVLTPTITKVKRKLRFYFYCLFALGVPVTVVVITAALDFTYRNDIESDVIVAQYGGFNCFMESKYAAGLYLYIPIGTLLAVNIVFFVATIYTMNRIQQSAKLARNSSSRSRTQHSQAQQGAVLFLKLFLVMGVTWILDVVTWATVAGTKTSSSNAWLVLLDLVYILQPIAIFVIFVCKPDVIAALKLKFPFLGRVLTCCTIETSVADSIIQRYPRLERFILPMTRGPNGRSMSCSTEISNVSWASVKQHGSRMNQVRMDAV